MNCDYRGAIKRQAEKNSRLKEQQKFEELQRRAKAAALEAAAKQVDDVVFRTRNKMYLAMLEAGLSTRTLAKVQNKLFDVVEPWYQKYMANPKDPDAGPGCADFALQERLKQFGVSFEETENEL